VLKNLYKIKISKYQKYFWQFSFIFLLIPFIWLNKFQALEVVNENNFYPEIYRLLLNQHINNGFLDNNINIIKYFFVLIAFFLIILTYSFQKKKELFLFKNFSLTSVNILIFSSFIIFYSISAKSGQKPPFKFFALLITFFFLFTFFYLKENSLKYLKVISYIFFIFLFYIISKNFKYIQPVEFHTYTIDLHYTSLLLDNFRIIDGVNIFDDPGKSSKLAYGFLNKFYFFFLQFFFKLDTNFILLFLKVLQGIFIMLILFLSYLRYNKIYLLSFFLLTSFFFNMTSNYMWFPNHGAQRFIFVIISFIFIWIFLKKYNNKYPFIYSIICFLAVLYNLETGVILLLALSGLFLFSQESFKQILIFIFIFLLLNFSFFFILYINNLNFSYLEFIKIWFKTEEKIKIGGANYVVYPPFICMLLHSLICICRNVSLRLKNIKLKFDFLVSAFFIGWGLYFVFRSSWEYTGLLFVIYSFIFLRLKSDLRWFFHNNLKYLRKIVIFFFIYAFSFHLWSIFKVNLFSLKLDPKKAGYVKFDVYFHQLKIEKENTIFQNIRESCAYLKKNENIVNTYITPFAVLTRSTCGTKNLLKTKKVDFLAHKDDFFNFLKYYLPSKFIVSKLNAYGSEVFPDYNDFHQDFINQLNNFGYKIIDEDTHWYMYEKNKI